MAYGGAHADCLHGNAFCRCLVLTAILQNLCMHNIVEDAAAAIDNMNESELCGETFKDRQNPFAEDREGGAAAEVEEGGELAAKKSRHTPRVFMDVKIGSEAAGRIVIVILRCSSKNSRELSLPLLWGERVWIQGFAFSPHHPSVHVPRW